jgi:hypothetical protein
MEKVLPEDVYEVTEMLILKRPLQGNTGIRMKKEPITAACGNQLFRSELNFLVAVAGRVFSNKKIK